MAIPTAFWSTPVSSLVRDLSTSDRGLAPAAAAQRLAQDGPNTLAAQKRIGPALLLLNQFRSPITLILIFAAAVSLGIRDFTDSAIVLLIVLVSGLLSFFQEYNASNAVSDLLNLVSVKTHVVRGGETTEILPENLVAGDVLALSGGDVVPADCALIASVGLTVDESTLTGETFPAEKSVAVLPSATPLAQRFNALWMGTHVVSGSATALVVHTANQTEFGAINARLRQREPETDFERGVREFGYLLMRVTIFLVLGIFVINIALDKPAMDSFLFSMALAVGLTPQLLPAIISINLSHGAKEMAERKVIVKKLSSIENFGSMNLLCSDKTGTVTAGIIELDDALGVDGHHSDAVLEAAAINAKLQAGYLNPIDAAIIRQRDLDPALWRKLGEIPYSFTNRRLSVMAALPPTSTLGTGPIMVTKGALTNVLEGCTTYLSPDGPARPLTDDVRHSIEVRYEALSSRGLRTLGVGIRRLQDNAPLPTRDDDLTFIGYLTFSDTLKPGITETIANMRALGVDLKIITGDNRLIARTIASQLGLASDDILTGEELNNLSDTALAARAVGVSIFAEIEPTQKERIIIALRRAGFVVGYMGDGINDASAIHRADVGISVNNAADVARDAASIVLLEQDLNVLVDGIRAGRKTFANTLKYVFMATSANFGNMFSMAGASLLLPFLPLLPMQVLLTNLMTDFPEMQIASDNVDAALVERPQRWNIAFIRRFMVVFGLISSIFDYATFGVLRLIVDASPALFRTGWFTESVISATLIVLIVRTRSSALNSRPGRGLLIATACVILATILLPFTPLASLLGFQRLTPEIGVWIAAIVAAYIITAESAKRIFYRSLPEHLQPGAIAKPLVRM